MLIPEDKLVVWASAPSATETEKIQNARAVIEDILKRRLPVDQIKLTHSLNSFKYEVYLQGSYANSTNIRFDSDVDIVVQLNDPFYPNKQYLTATEQQLYDSSHRDVSYTFEDFKKDVHAALASELSSQVHWADKCIDIDGNTHRVKADVVPCLQYRVYKRFISSDNHSFVEGMKFCNTSDSSEIINYPKQHLKNCESKNVDTSGNFKSVVRIYKNMRNVLADKGLLDKGQAPSYFIENLLYNCSSPCFDGNYSNCMITSLQFISDAIESGRITGFICANEQDSLISPQAWNLDDLINYFNLVAKLYLGQIAL